MSNEDKMLQLVLSDKNLSSFYDFNVADFPTIKDAFKADNPIVVSVAKIINGIGGNSEKSIQKEVYTEVFNYLNGNIL
jgi:hypothetical protein